MSWGRLGFYTIVTNYRVFNAIATVHSLLPKQHLHHELHLSLQPAGQRVFVDADLEPVQRLGARPEDGQAHGLHSLLRALGDWRNVEHRLVIAAVGDNIRPRVADSLGTGRELPVDGADLPFAQRAADLGDERGAGVDEYGHCSG